MDEDKLKQLNIILTNISHAMKDTLSCIEGLTRHYSLLDRNIEMIHELLDKEASDEKK